MKKIVLSILACLAIAVSSGLIVKHFSHSHNEIRVIDIPDSNSSVMVFEDGCSFKVTSEVVSISFK